jgi:hypothetical protein
MKLRDDLLMCYRGVSNWPPAWVGKDVQQSQQLGGEIGILKTVIQSKIKPLNRLYLTINSHAREPTNFSCVIVANPFTKLVKLRFPS